ncbi:MAG: arsenate reductase ArsC [Rhodothermales bacterium]|nr:arsenate reductase ArsC [Rhodothermales bacterium]
MPNPTVLFVCTHNSARSQLAEALLRHDHGDRFESFSAGTEETRVKPEALTVLEEIGVDTSPLFSKTVDRFVEEPADYVITVCDAAGEACPWLPARVKLVHHGFEDPSNETSSPEARVEAFRKTRDEIRGWLEETFSGEVPQL